MYQLLDMASLSLTQDIFHCNNNDRHFETKIWGSIVKPHCQNFENLRVLDLLQQGVI